MTIDSDYAFLKAHLSFIGAIRAREDLAKKVASALTERIHTGRLPYTLGVFGGWGAGKTTFLALLANELEHVDNCKVVYFNSWKYAGFMEIVPALIYKVLRYGMTRKNADPEEAAKRVLLALGKKYSDQIGDWAEKKIGINVTELFKDAYDLKTTIQENSARVNQQVIRAYYTQVDKAQDELREALGPVVSGQSPDNAVVVLIDELDRCDPDEAFNVIKQMRVLFGMRDLPVAFVVCANPDPIGRAIKHRYGLESDDYEARRILEKFVDSYEDLAQAVALGPVVQVMWKAEKLPWIVDFDQANQTPRFEDDVILNARPFDAITSGVPLLSNLRVLHKSFEYVHDNGHVNRSLLWTKWLLEIAKQIDPSFRHDLSILAGPIQDAICESYIDLRDVPYRVRKANASVAITFQTDKGNTLFAILRSCFWEHAKSKLAELNKSKEPEDTARAHALASLLSKPLRVDFVVLLSLLPFDQAPVVEKLGSTTGTSSLPDLTAQLDSVNGEFGYELANI
ncbi:MAG TPA: P-loop NTPase fold protein [Candidatus Angelobacter sp.]